MSYSPKRLFGLGLTAALLSTSALSACGGDHRDTPAAAPASTHESSGATAPAPSGENGEGEGGAAHAAMDMDTLPVEKRVAFMSGHVEAGLALYRAGAPDQAARHLLHPVSETHAAERAGIDALGFTPEVFQDVSRDLEAGKSASEIEPLLAKAEANIDLMRKNAGGNTADIIDFLMNTCANEYQMGVTDGAIVNAGEYQDAYGFAVVARDLAADLQADPLDPLRKELEVLVRMWPNEGPLAASTPAPVSQIAAQVARVKLELSSLE